jgi:rhodanese-related sulfurtransferase
MAVTLSKETERAVEHFQSKLAFEIGPFEVKEGKEPFQIIDLRSKELFEKGRIPGSINILYEDLESRLPSLKKDVTSVVLCYNITCHLATRAALLLAQKGYKVRELVGGWEEYAKYGLPVEGKAEVSSCSTDSGKSSCGG